MDSVETGEVTIVVLSSICKGSYLVWLCRVWYLVLSSVVGQIVVILGIRNRAETAT